MYHGRFKGSHNEAGFQYGAFLKNHGKIIHGSPTSTITDELPAFAKSCLPVYREYYPEVLEEMQGMADGQCSPLEYIADLLLPMYCFEPDHHCTAFAVADGTTIMLCKNSDFLVSHEKLYMNCLYALSGAHAFNGNTTAFIQIEDGMNEKGLVEAMKEYRTPPDVDSWRAEERYETARNALVEHGGQPFKETVQSRHQNEILMKPFH